MTKFKISRYLWLLVATGLALLILRNPPRVVQAQAAGGSVCHVALVFDRSGSVSPANMDAMRTQVRRLFQPGGLNSSNIQLAFWSFASTTSTHTPGYVPPPFSNQNAPFYGFVSSAGVDSGFDTAMNQITPGGQTNYVEGFGFSKASASAPFVANPAIQSIVDQTDIIIFMTDGQPNEPSYAGSPNPEQLGRQAALIHINAGRDLMGGFIGTIATDPSGVPYLDPITGLPITNFNGRSTLNNVINGNPNDTTDTFNIDANFDNLSALLRNRINSKCQQASVDLKVNGSDTPADINIGDPIRVSYNANNVNSCTSAGQWVGTNVPPPSGLVNRDSDSSSQGTKTYTINCVDRNGNRLSDTVNIIVRGPPSTRPYLRSYGGDVRAGATFDTDGGACDITAVGNTGAIKTYSAASGGAGNQFAAIAASDITDFASAMLRTSNPSPPIGLSFANSGVNTTSPINGGQFGNNYCISTYARWAPPATSTAIGNPYNIANISGAPQNMLVNGPLTILGGTVSGMHTLYVDGDVRITGNINYSGGGNWSSLNQIPQLYIIAKGNIYIEPGVTNLDGTYVAVPKTFNSTTDGIIYTCSSPGNFDRMPLSGIAAGCKSQLTVHGSMSAQNIRFSRVFGTITDANAAESPISGARACNGSPPSAAVCAGEVFILSPEAYLPTLAPNPSASLLNLQYDYVTTLPPVF